AVPVLPGRRSSITQLVTSATSGSVKHTHLCGGPSPISRRWNSPPAMCELDDLTGEDLHLGSQSGVAQLAIGAPQPKLGVDRQAERGGPPAQGVDDRTQGLERAARGLPAGCAGHA